MKQHTAKYICMPPVGKSAYILPVLGIGGFLALWFVLTAFQVFPPALVPSPAATLNAFGKMLSSGTLFSQGGASLWRIAQAVFWATALGVPVGILMGAFGTIEGLLKGILMPLRNAPIIAFIPIFMMMFGIEERMKVWFLVFGTVVYMIPTTFDAVRSVPQTMVDRAVDLGFRPWGTLWYFVIPAALPRIFDGIKVCTGIAWTYLVVAEVVNVTTGLGAIVQTAQRFQDTPKVWAGIVVILACGLATDYLFGLAQRHVTLLQPENQA